MKICAISDLHGDLIKVPECDVVVMSGDFVPLHMQSFYQDCVLWYNYTFLPWIESLPCEKFIFCAGNHDFCCTNPNWKLDASMAVGMKSLDYKVVYLENESYIFKGKKFFGCPYSSIPGWAFSTVTGDPAGYGAIEPDVDVLLVHQAPDLEKLGTSNIGTDRERNFGSKKLLNVILDRKPKVVVCGHIHSGNHEEVIGDGIRYYNASIKNEDYHITYKPQIFEI